MDIHKRIQDINNRWDISDDESYKEKFDKFKRRILNFFSDIDSHVSEGSVSMFCNAMGIEEKWQHEKYGYQKWSYNIINALTREDDPKKFFRLIEIIFALDIRSAYGHGGIIKFSRQGLIRKTQEAIQFSNIGITMHSKEGDVTLYPSGEKMLDKKTIDPVLSFLTGDASQHFVDALKFYQQNTPKSRVKSAESLRRALEEFLKLKLNNQKGLKENISVLGKKLKEIKANNDLKNLITQILSVLDHPFFNNNSKHKDGNIDEAENEYLNYQISLLMRYIEKILK